LESDYDRSNVIAPPYPIFSLNVVVIWENLELAIVIFELPAGFRINPAPSA